MSWFWHQLMSRFVLIFICSPAVGSTGTDFGSNSTGISTVRTDAVCTRKTVPSSAQTTVPLFARTLASFIRTDRCTVMRTVYRSPARFAVRSSSVTADEPAPLRPSLLHRQGGKDFAFSPANCVRLQQLYLRRQEVPYLRAIVRVKLCRAEFSSRVFVR